ncbi:MAG: helix-turn-helix transcriptional regulator [Lachnospiraceae bacterium]|nr:helix-turn-helix transcriptional regulator [Lachnospiraceae bacterium]
MIVIGPTDSFGSLLRVGRLSQNLTLAGLSEGLCSTATLSRIEAGERDPGYLLAASLTERLGMSVKHLEMVLTDEEFDRLEKRRAIDALVARGDGSAETKLGEYESLVEEGDVLERQFICHRRALARLVKLGIERLLLGSGMGGEDADTSSKQELEEIRKLLGEALGLTLGGGMPSARGSGMTVTERSIAVEMSCADQILGCDEREKTGCFLRLREAFAGIEAMKDAGDLLSGPLSLAALACASWYYKREEFPQALSICGKAFDLLDGSGDARGKGFVCFARAKALSRLDPADEAAACLARELFKLAYHLFGHLGDANSQMMVEDAI